MENLIASDFLTPARRVASTEDELVELGVEAFEKEKVATPIISDEVAAEVRKILAELEPHDV